MCNSLLNCIKVVDWLRVESLLLPNFARAVSFILFEQNKEGSVGRRRRRSLDCCC